MTTTRTAAVTTRIPSAAALGDLAPFEPATPNRLSVLGGFEATATANDTMLACSLSWTVSIV